MKQFFLPLGLTAALGGCLLTSCVDNDYDLSDVDTTVRVDVKDLIVPINIDQITLESVISIDEDDEHIATMDDGTYYYHSDGDFSSETVSIDAISVNVPNINPATLNINTWLGADFTVPAIPADIDLNLNNGTESTFQLHAYDISDDIVSIESIGTEFTLQAKLDLTQFNSCTSKVRLNGIQIELPTGFTTKPSSMGEYDSATGIFSLNDDEYSTAEELVVPIEFTACKDEGRFNAAEHSFDVNAIVGIKGTGSITLLKDALKVGARVPEQFSLSIKFETSRQFTVETFTGTAKYSIDTVHIPEVDLDDLPDVLSQPGTDLVFDNPCIYIQVNNPLQEYNLYAKTGMEIVAERDDEADKTFTLAPFQIGPGNSTGLYNFCLSPQKPSSYDLEFASGCEHVEFATLGGVLSGNGLPKTLKIGLTDPTIPAQRVENFDLGKQYEGVKGKYKFIAPFDLKAGSVIEYQDTMDGWWSEDLDYLTITALDVNVNVSTDVPVGVEFTGYPIDKNHQQINNVQIQGAQVNANANNQAVTIHITGSVTGLDGIIFKAKATADDGSALNKNMTITLTNVRPKASGYYQKEL